MYKLDELKALVKYADERGVTMVPELETPGHSGNACATLPECFGFIDPATGKAVGQGMMNIANPKLYETLDTIIGEMCDVFQSSPYFLPAMRVDVAVSNDGKTFAPAGTISFAIPNNRASRGLTMKELTVAAKGSGRYVKVFCKNNGVLPAWHEYPGVPDHMMLDEILVNP